VDAFPQKLLVLFDYGSLNFQQLKLHRINSNKIKKFVFAVAVRPEAVNGHLTQKTKSKTVLAYRLNCRDFRVDRKYRKSSSSKFIYSRISVFFTVSDAYMFVN
jgi:hypothetical protein